MDELGDDTPNEGRGRWMVEQVTGRGSDSSRGLAPVNDITIAGPDGRSLTFGRVRSETEQALHFVALGVPTFHDFGQCPICLNESLPLTREHVPQGDLGGRVMTMTCKACNNRLGSRVEGELKDWFDDALRDVRFSGGEVPGRRRSPRLLYRRTATGEFGLIPDKGKSDADLGAMLASGSMNMQFSPPDKKVWAVAAMKHAYLGACLALEALPDSPMGHRVRFDLVAARDAGRGTPFPESRIAMGLRVMKSYEAARGPAIVLGALVDEQGVMRDGGLSLAGTLFVSWPLEVELFKAAVEKAETAAGETPPAESNGGSQP